MREREKEKERERESNDNLEKMEDSEEGEEK